MTCQRDGAALLFDEGSSLRMWEADRDAIETGPRLAQQKFGQTLTLLSPSEFQVAAARVAAEIRLNLEFDAPALNCATHGHQHEFDALAETQRRQERERDEALRKLARDYLRPSRPEQRDNEERGVGDKPIDLAQNPELWH